MCCLTVFSAEGFLRLYECLENLIKGPFLLKLL